MKIIILGAGQVGGTLAENLAGERNDITVIDIDGERLRELGDRLDIGTVLGMGCYPWVLKEAGAEDADMLIAVTNSDEVNMVACQVAYTLFRTPTKIARIRTAHYTSRADKLFNENAIPIDVIISPEQVVTDYIKRLIGLPGDTVQMKAGLLHINGEPVQVEDGGVFSETKEPQGPEGRYPRCSNDPVGEGGVCEKERLIETLPGGVRHSTLNIQDGLDLDDTKVFTVPEGHFFFIGDNRDNSTDSRVAQTSFGVGMVPFENLIGRADRIMFSSAGRSMLFFWTWRGDRFFKAID